MGRKTDRRIDLLQRVPLLDGCSRRDVTRLARLADDVEVPAGEVVVREGERGFHFYVLIDGAAEVSIGDRVLGTIEAGSFFGEMAILEGKPRAATVTTILPSRILVLDARQLWQFLADVPLVAQRVMRGMATRLRQVEGELVLSLSA